MVSDQWLLLASWIVVFAVLVGWGAVIRRLWRAPIQADPADFLLCFWLGWAAVLVVLQLWHFVWPIDGRARWLVVAGGLLGLPLLLRPGRRLVRRLPRALPLLAALAGIGVWLSNRALDGARFGDAGGYYVPTIRWIIEHPLVIGLANLYPPYAYNQSYFLYAALLDGGPFAGRAHHLLNGMLLAVLAARTLLGLWRASPTAVDVFYALMLPAEAEAAAGYLFTSPAPDFGVYALGIVLSGELIAVETSAEGEAGALWRHFLSLALLAAIAPTVKLPIVGLAAAAMLVGTVVWIRRVRRQWQTMTIGLALAAAFGVLALGPWMAGNILMSGCPLFPSAAMALDVPWRVNWNVQRWIANTMIIGDWRLVLHNPGWVAQRFVAMGWTQPNVSVPAGVAVGALVLGAAAAAIRPLGQSPRIGRRVPIALLLPPLASLVLCIATTPVPRYAGATLWLLAAQSVMVALGGRLPRPAARRAIVVGAVALAALPFASGAPLWLAMRRFATSPHPVVAPRQLASGLVVFVPPSAACWDAALPCTPQPHAGLRLRRPPDLGSGFEVEPGTAPPQRLGVPGVR